MKISQLRCGLIGEHLRHSFSPQIHACLADYPYTLCELAPHEVEGYLKRRDFDAINVTIPYKKTVIPFLDEISDEARRIGSVNTIVHTSEGKLIGYNTDYYGFLYMLQSTNLSVKDKKILVLGSGGASVTICTVLQDLGARTVVISRKGENHYGNLEKHADASIIVNTTPVGMYPNNGESPVDLSLFPNLCGVLDIVYNPARTRLLLDAEARNITTANGLTMLTAQAARAVEYFTGEKVKTDAIQAACASVTAQMQNIILIGMPGCGKSTIGKIVAQACQKRFVDADEVFAKTHPRTPAQIIAEEGEEAFRAMEHKIICELGKESGCVIATGGGVVTKEENYAPLHQNGSIVWIDRPLDKLSTEGRPLSQAKGVDILYRERVDAYRRFADLRVENNENVEDAANAILQQLKIHQGDIS